MRTAIFQSRSHLIARFFAHQLAAVLVLISGTATPMQAFTQPGELPPPRVPPPAAQKARAAELKDIVQENSTPQDRAKTEDRSKAEDRSTGGPATSASANKSDNRPALPPDFIKLYLMDGAVITGRLSMKEIAVETQFGRLNVPVTSIKTFTPGLVSHPVLAKEVSGLIADLGSSNYNDREKAQQALVKMGLPIRGELEKHQNDSDVERRNRIKAILSEFDQLAEGLDAGDGDVPAMRDRDTVETTDFTIVGKIVPQSFTIASPYGELNIKLADVRRGQREIGKKDDVRQSFSVDATHLAMRSTLNTNIRLERGDVVTVTADGTITMTPWGTGALSTPDGAPNYGWFIPGQIASGTLVGKVGNESFMKLGSKTTFTAERSGVLQLGIGMQADYAENQFPGKYSVKVRVQRKN
jgi:hypothetical protein